MDFLSSNKNKPNLTLGLDKIIKDLCGDGIVDENFIDLLGDNFPYFDNTPLNQEDKDYKSMYYTLLEKHIYQRAVLSLIYNKLCALEKQLNNMEGGE